MGILFDNPPQEEKEKGFHLTLEKYKNVVFVKSIKVSEDDDCVLTVEFDHNIEDVPEGEVADEVGRLILEKLEQGLGMMDTDNITVEKE